MDTVADRMLAPVAVIAPDSTLLYVNGAAARSVGHEPSWLVGRRMLDLVHADDRERVAGELQRVALGRPSAGVTRYRLRADGARKWRVFESIADNLMDDPTVAGILISARDITEQQAREDELFEAAFRDALTGLPNRAKVLEDLAAGMSQATALDVAMIGLDRFKLINDSLGHAVGDDVLRAVSSRLVSALPSSAVVGRLTADVFVVLFEGLDGADAGALMWRLVERVGEPLFIAGRELRLSSSVGLAHKDAASTAESLLHAAGLALHQSKAMGGGRVEVFERAMRDAAVARLELEADLRVAIAGADLSLALQPIVRLSDGAAVGAEALVRWHTTARTIPPCEFIPVAEETGLIVPLGDWTIERAAQLARSAPGGRVNVNLSARHLASPGLPERIARQLASQELPASALAFEITETLLIEHFDYTVGVLHAIREIGCQIGLDDFGTGYSSLGYLRRLPIDFLKIDGSLLTGIDSDRPGRAIVQAIITMADALALDVVAEGVETESHAAALREIGCEFAQGYLFGRPIEGNPE